MVNAHTNITGRILGAIIFFAAGNKLVTNSLTASFAIVHFVELEPAPAQALLMSQVTAPQLSSPGLKGVSPEPRNSN